MCYEKVVFIIYSDIIIIEQVSTNIVVSVTKST